jgi:hypothetical protein
MFVIDGFAHPKKAAQMASATKAVLIQTDWLLRLTDPSPHPEMRS